MVLTMDAKRRLTVPASLAPLSPGDTFEAIFDTEEQEIIFRRINQKTNWVEIFKQCPVPMDDLPSRSRQYPKRLSLD